MISLIFTSLISLSSCELKQEGYQFFLHYEGKKHEIKVTSPKPEIFQCSTLPHQPQILVAEIDLGFAGTSIKLNTRDLVIFKIEKNQLKKIYQKEIGEYK